MNRLILFSSILLLAFAFSFCSDEDNPTKAENLDNNLIGKWVITDSNDDLYAWTFESDGSCVQTLYNQDYNWKWEIEEGQIKLFVDGGKAAYYTYKIEGNQLYLWVDSVEDWGIPYTKE